MKLSEDTWKKVQGADAYAVMNAPLIEQYTYLAHFLLEKMRPHVQMEETLSDEELESCIKNTAVLLKNAKITLQKMKEQKFFFEDEPAKEINMAARYARHCNEMWFILGILTQRKASELNRDLAARALAIFNCDKLNLTDMTTQNPERLKLIISEFVKTTGFAQDEKGKAKDYCRDTMVRFLSCEQGEDGHFTMRLECSLTHRSTLKIGGMPVIFPEMPDDFYKANKDYVFCDLITGSGTESAISMEYEVIEPLQDGDYGSAIITCRVPENTKYLRINAALGGRTPSDAWCGNIENIIAEAKQRAELGFEPNI